MPHTPALTLARHTARRLALAGGLALAATASFAFTLPMTPSPIRADLVHTEAANADKVGQLVALAAIQSDLQLALLFVQESGVPAAAPFLVRPATETWPAIKDGVMALNHAQFEALFAGLDWRKVKALDTRPPAAAE